MRFDGDGWRMRGQKWRGMRWSRWEKKEENWLAQKKRRRGEDGKGVPEIQQTWAHYSTYLYSLSLCLSKKSTCQRLWFPKKIFLYHIQVFWQFFLPNPSRFSHFLSVRGLSIPPPPASVAWSITGEDSRRKKRKKRRVLAQKSGKLEQEKRFFRKSKKVENLGQVSSVKLAFLWYSVFPGPREREVFFKMRRKKKG